MDIEWIVFGAIVVVVAVGWILLSRRYRRWTPRRGSTPEAQAAEARLWSTKIGDQSGGGAA